MDDKQFESFNKKMDTIAKLLAFNIINGKAVNEQVEILTKAGLKASDIAEILGKTENQIYVTQSLLRKRKKSVEGTATNESAQPLEGGVSNV
ncbi:MAG: hypothetical protein ACREBU_01880 [Nitrososphaera sp.]